jgi:hypothetical protein
MDCGRKRAEFNGPDALMIHGGDMDMKMRKWENENRSLIGRMGNISVTGRGVVESESDKVLDQKMQENKVHGKDVAHER